ncbi:MAG: putative metal-dependent hydrolase [Cytophagaceae bacterium]|nr:putative metal-dependent hydrolase [Cytophagaceae bacterium]
MEHLRYPIGRFIAPDVISQDNLLMALESIRTFPEELKHLTESLSDSELAKTYRPEGWTIRQVVHHCADSHSNSFIRVKLALTEESPTIKPYEEALWAALFDGSSLPIEPSLLQLQGIHYKWYHLFNRLSADQWQRTYIHPEHGKSFTLAETALTYAWHGLHHMEHIKLALRSNT